MSDAPLLELAGTPRERGLAHGRARADRLRAFVDDGLARLAHLTDTVPRLEDMRGDIAAHRDAVAEAIPDLAEEVEGLAAGAGLDRDLAWLLQLRRELLGYSRVTAGDCTAYAAAGGVLAQTVDLNGNLDDQIAVLEVAGPPCRSLLLSFGGLLGYLGVNDAGVAVGLNLVLGGTWRPGVPPYLAIRHVLDTAESVDHAVEILRGLPLASSRSFMLCGPDRAVCVEALGDRRRVLEGPRLWHANHYLDPEFAEHDQINVFAKNSSRRRLEAAREGGVPDPDDIDAHHRLLSEPPIRVPDNGDIRRERTVAAVVLRPDLRRLHLWPGDPADAKEHVWSLR